MKLAAFVLSTLSVLKAAAGASVIENAGQEAVLFKAFDKEDVVVGSRSRSRSARNTPEHTTCKQTCIAEECSDSSDGNRCKTECKKRCDSNTNYSDFSSSFSFDSPDQDAFASEDGGVVVKELVAGDGVKSLTQPLVSRRNLRH